MPSASLSPSQFRTTYNIRTIYDLRRADEWKMTPSLTTDRVETVWMPSTADESLYWLDKAGAKKLKEGPLEVPTHKQAIQLRELWYHADLLQSLEVAARCIDELNKIDQFYYHQYNTLLLKLYPTRRWQHLDHDNHNHV